MSSNQLYFSHTAGSSPVLAPVAGMIGQLGVRKTAELIPISHPVHTHSGIELCYVIKEPHTWRLGHHDYRLLPGEIFMTYPGQKHTCLNGPFDRGYMAWIEIIPEHFTPDGKLMLGNWSGLDREDQTRIGRILAENHNPVIPAGLKLVETIRDINAELQYKKPFYLARVRLMVDSIVIGVARALSEKGTELIREDDFINEVHARMSQNLANKIMIGDLAYSFGMSPSSFNNKVKALLGTSPADYLIGLRILRAKELLAATDWTVTRIALECGFYSSQHFARLFVAREGLRPLEYRIKAHQAP